MTLVFLALLQDPLGEFIARARERDGRIRMIALRFVSTPRWGGASREGVWCRDGAREAVRVAEGDAVTHATWDGAIGKELAGGRLVISRNRPEALLLLQSSPAHWGLVWNELQSCSMKVLGENETIAGRACVRVACGHREFWINADTALILKSVVVPTRGEFEVEEATGIGDLWIPTRCVSRTFHPGGEVSGTTFEIDSRAVRINEPVDPELFEIRPPPGMVIDDRTGGSASAPAPADGTGYVWPLVGGLGIVVVILVGLRQRAR